MYNLKLNPAKCTFGVPTGKLLGFIVSRQGIELDPSKVKAIQDLPPPKSKKDVRKFLGRLNYISHFIAQSTMICELIFKMLKKDAATSWTEECQKAFDIIKEYLFTPPVLHPDKNFIDHIPVRIHNQPAYCSHVKEEVDGNPWFHDTKNN
ncbi:putative mitochondrial protein AtMg00860 [Nicotiana tabacum]|uniref:Mitochondrial protein AtMg00860 n=1 Tax=Nicotiana tabacum TaxID=4097 RepID=A0AC58RU86_TOBAC